MVPQRRVFVTVMLLLAVLATPLVTTGLPTAEASGPPYGGVNFDTTSGLNKVGLTQIKMRYNTDTKSRRFALSWDDVDPNAAPADHTFEAWPSGSTPPTKTFRLEWSSNSSTPDGPDYFHVEFRVPGTTSWSEYTNWVKHVGEDVAWSTSFTDQTSKCTGWPTTNDANSGCLQTNITIDSDMSNGTTADAVRYGPVEALLFLHDNDSNDEADSLGHATCTNCSSEYSFNQGDFAVTAAMVGEHTDHMEKPALVRHNEGSAPFNSSTTNNDPCDAPDGGNVNEQWNGFAPLGGTAKGTGKDMAVVRIFKDFPTDVNNLVPDDVQEYLCEGRSVIYSIKPPLDGSGNPKWGELWKYDANCLCYPNRDLASGVMYELSVAAANANGAAQIYFVWSHEPHDNSCGPRSSCADNAIPSGKYGNNEQFVETFQDLSDLLKGAACGFPEDQYISLVDCSRNIQMMYVAVDSKASAGSPVGSGDLLYPGEHYVDILGHDVYNYSVWGSGSCNGHACDRSFGYKMSQASYKLAELAERDRKPLLIAEFQTHPGCVGGGNHDFGCNGTETSTSRDDWFRSVAAYLGCDSAHTTDASITDCKLARKWFVGFAMYDTDHTSSGGHDWRFIDYSDYDGPDANTTKDYASDWPQSEPASGLQPGLTGYKDAFVNNSVYNANLNGGASYFKGSPVALNQTTTVYTP